MLIYDFLLLGLITDRIIIFTIPVQTVKNMNIKITIKDADSGPMLIHKNQLSQTEFRKKNSLYQQPQRDKNTLKKDKTNKASRDDKALRATGVRSSGQNQSRKAELKMMEDLDKMSKNQVSQDMLHNTNNILQKQTEILSQNQKAVYEMAKNSHLKQNNNEVRQFENMLGEVKREVNQMKKIKQEIERSSKAFARAVQEGKEGTQQAVPQQIPGNVAEMNSNLKHLAQISKNQLDGLENMEGIKSLQNFNIEGYTQAINGLKKQIVQYQKQSQQIERQLKLRAAKLQKLEIKPNFDEEMLAPYEAYLKKKAQAVDLYAIRERVYEKLGMFDYGKFENDVNGIMSGVKGQMNDFYIICKQYKIEVPDIKIDQKELKGLDLKLPSAIDEFKAERGIQFIKPTESKESYNKTGGLADSRNRQTRKKGEAILSMKNTGPKTKAQKYAQGIRELNSKPVDLTTQVKFRKTDEPTQKTVLEVEREKNKKLVEGNMKRMRKGKEDQDFQKYLEYRARDELETLYKQKQERLNKKQQELFDYCNDQPEVYLNLDLRNQVRRSGSKERRQEERSPKKQIQEEKKPIKEEQQEIPRLKPIPGTQGQTIKEVGTDILKQKLRNLLGSNNARRPPMMPSQPNIQQQNVPQPQSEMRLENVAQNFISMINNTLTQVNNNLSKSIQSKYEQRSLSKQRQDNFRRSPPKITIPKLQQFRPPPTFNMPVYSQRPQAPIYQPQPLPSAPVERPRPEQKIVIKNYDHLKIKDQEQSGQLQISQDSYAQDFQ